MTAALIFLGILFLLAFYYFMILPQAVIKELERRKPPRLDYYYKDYDNLCACIKRASNKEQISNCCDAVYSFRMRNRALARRGIQVDKDTDYLIKILDEQLYKINGKPKRLPRIKLFY